MVDGSRLNSTLLTQCQVDKHLLLEANLLKVVSQVILNQYSK